MPSVVVCPRCGKTHWNVRPYHEIVKEIAQCHAVSKDGKTCPDCGGISHPVPDEFFQASLKPDWGK